MTSFMHLRGKEMQIFPVSEDVEAKTWLKILIKNFKFFQTKKLSEIRVYYPFKVFKVHLFNYDYIYYDLLPL